MDATIDKKLLLVHCRCRRLITYIGPSVSAAQALAAVIAFLLAGYALVYTMMEATVAADETLQEVNDELKRRYHLWLSVLMVLTAAAIIADLCVVYANGLAGAHWSLQLTAGTLTIASLVGAVLFVLAIVDPDKYQRTARQLVGPTTPGTPGLGGVSAADFFFEFVEIERRIRELWEPRLTGDAYRDGRQSRRLPR